MGPLLAAFMTETLRWSVPFWVYLSMNILALALVICFLQETYYDRGIAADEQPARGSRIARLTGVAQWKSRHLRNTFGQACWRTASVFLKPVIAISCVFYALVSPGHHGAGRREVKARTSTDTASTQTFAWAVGINTTLAIFVTPLYGFGPRQVGFFYFTPVVAVILGEATGHWMHDALAKRYVRRHNGRFEPEARLRAVFCSMPFVVVGLVLIGQCFENGWHYMALSVCWGMYVFGMMITTVALSSYCLDSYPEASGEVAAWLNMARTVGGFIVSYFQVAWAEAQGTKLSFGIQAAVCAGAFLFIIVLLRWGKAMRVWAGPLSFATT